MKPYQRRFLDLAVAGEILRFGEFTLKSGRVSPYFFNAGRFDHGAALAALGGCYADALLDSGLNVDMLFGPAYKGIPLATATSIALAARGSDLPLAFNRKEAKAHGIPIIAIARLSELLTYTGERPELQPHREALLAYRRRYGVVAEGETDA